jgi:hypothetical protein
MADLAITIPKFYTDHGEVHYVKGDNGRSQFQFFNPKAVTHERTTAYMKTFTALANYLPEAQLAAGNFIKLRDNLSSTLNADDVQEEEEAEEEGTEEEEEETGGEEEGEGEEDKEEGEEERKDDKKGDGKTPEKVEPNQKEALETGNADTANQASGEDKNSIYTKILNVYGTEPIIRQTLIVSIYEGNPYITLRRFWYTKNDCKTSLPAWIPCFGSYRFSLADDAHELLRFAKECVKEEEEASKKAWSSKQQLLLRKRTGTPTAAILHELKKKVKRPLTVKGSSSSSSSNSSSSNSSSSKTKKTTETPPTKVEKPASNSDAATVLEKTVPELESAAGATAAAAAAAAAENCGEKEEEEEEELQATQSLI